MIYCIWYPSGGFGHFINAVLTLRGKNFVRPKNHLNFSSNGNSHGLDLVVPKYLHECWPGGIEFLDDKNYCVLIDNGINNESTKFKDVFPKSPVIKVCYNDYSWPVVARTMIDKAMVSSIEEQLSIDAWNTTEPWAQREKYFLYLRDHHLRYAWQMFKKRDILCTEINVGDLYHSYKDCFEAVNEIEEIEPFEDLWTEWRKANVEYINPIETAKEVVRSVSAKEIINLTHITDIWMQAVIYYFIWVRYGVEVPHNDFANFFTSTEQIIDLVK